MGSLDTQVLCKISFCKVNKWKLRKDIALSVVAMKVAGVVVIVAVIVLLLSLFADHEQKFKIRIHENIGALVCVNFFQWFFQPIQGPGLLFSSRKIFHRE
jgi:hypothetical protein